MFATAEKVFMSPITQINYLIINYRDQINNEITKKKNFLKSDRHIRTRLGHKTPILRLEFLFVTFRFRFLIYFYIYSSFPWLQTQNTTIIQEEDS